MRGIAVLGPAGLAVLFALGCVSGYRSFERSRQAYVECREAHPDDPEACAEEATAAEAEYERYERAAQRQWGCRNAPDECAEPRPGQP
jgi:hypothetical protein